MENLWPPFATGRFVYGKQLIVAALLFCQYATASGQSGVRVVSAPSAGPAYQSGLQEGDLITGWRRDAAQGGISTPFELEDVELKYGTLGIVTLTGARAGKQMQWIVKHEPWRLESRPSMTQALEEQYKTTIALGPQAASNRLDTLASSAKTAEPAWASWLLFHSAEVLLRDAAGRALPTQQAVKDFELAAALMDANARATLLCDAAKLFAEREDYTRQKTYLNECEAALPGANAGTLLPIRVLLGRMQLANGHGEYDQTEQFGQKVLEQIGETRQHSSLAFSAYLSMAGSYYYRERFEASTHAAEKALAIAKILGPGAVDSSGALNSIALNQQSSGETDKAEETFTAALAAAKEWSPLSISVGRVYSNRAMLELEAGRIDEGMKDAATAVEIFHQAAPNSKGEMLAWNLLGVGASDARDLPRSEMCLRKALSIAEQQHLSRSMLTGIRMNLGDIVLSRGDTAGAKQIFARLVEVQRKVSVTGSDFALPLAALAGAERRSGESAAAEPHAQQAAALEKTASPVSTDYVDILLELGRCQKANGNRKAAENTFGEALQVLRKVAPGSWREADTEHEVGLLCVSEEKWQDATDHFERSIAALEQQTAQISGSDDRRADFSAQYATFYLDYIDLLLSQRQNATAFHVLERSRARSLLRMLAERELKLNQDIPPELSRERKRVAAEYDRARSELLDSMGGNDAGAIATLTSKTEKLQLRRSELDERIRNSSPRVAALRGAAPLKVEEARAALDPGTVLVDYSVGKDHCDLFALAANSELKVLRLPVGEAHLRSEVTSLRNAIEGKNEPGKSSSAAAFPIIAARLYRELLAPIEEQLANADRILIVPDGVLHVLPFAALMRNRHQYLVEWKPLHTEVSMTVYAETKKTRQKSAAKKNLVAFGDPDFGTAAAVLKETASYQQRRAVLGRAFSPLPFSREEVDAISRAYKGPSRKYLGLAATKEQAINMGRSARYLHFATHSLFDERFPLNSALVFSRSPANPGIDGQTLEAWQIIEQARWDADLVVLSACQTGLGKEIAGEGLVGLSRAIQYAGARSILASLWSIDDRRTSELMEQFYLHLQSGEHKDEALRSAQLKLIHSAVASKPIYWSAFVLSGDWQ